MLFEYNMAVKTGKKTGARAPAKDRTVKTVSRTAGKEAPGGPAAKAVPRGLAAKAAASASSAGAARSAPRSGAPGVYDESKIKTLSSLEHIRLRTGMYIGRLGDGSNPD
ncbi:MAG: type IIA DNA topoisomerase subunit B, partial [Treponema sp.]|nr:type IIA DNA topoisomerase subunit B [Treponema sp.]